MCGRASSSRSFAAIGSLTKAKVVSGTASYVPGSNLGPSSTLPVLKTSTSSATPAEDGEEEKNKLANDTTPSIETVLQPMRWGLVPFFVKSEDMKKTGYNTINARAETVASKSFFRHLVNKRRCIVVIDGFYEWRKFERMGQSKKQPFFIHPRRQNKGDNNDHSKDTTESPDKKQTHPEAEDTDRPLLYLAGLYDTNKNGEGELQTCTIITTQPTQEFGFIHDRMPVVLQGENINKWLDPKMSFKDCFHMLSPYKDNNLVWYRVSDTVNSIKNKGLECLLDEPSFTKKKKARGIGRFFTAKPKKDTDGSSKRERDDDSSDQGGKKPKK